MFKQGGGICGASSSNVRRNKIPYPSQAMSTHEKSKAKGRDNF